MLCLIIQHSENIRRQKSLLTPSGTFYLLHIMNHTVQSTYGLECIYSGKLMVLNVNDLKHYKEKIYNLGCITVILQKGNKLSHMLCVGVLHLKVGHIIWKRKQRQRSTEQLQGSPFLNEHFYINTIHFWLDSNIKVTSGHIEVPVNSRSDAAECWRSFQSN